MIFRENFEKIQEIPEKGFSEKYLKINPRENIFPFSRFHLQNRCFSITPSGPGAPGAERAPENAQNHSIPHNSMKTTIFRGIPAFSPNSAPFRPKCRSIAYAQGILGLFRGFRHKSAEFTWFSWKNHFSMDLLIFAEFYKFHMKIAFPVQVQNLDLVPVKSRYSGSQIHWNHHKSIKITIIHGNAPFHPIIGENQ